MAKAYVLQGSRYYRFDVESDRLDSGYPKEIASGWSGIEGSGFESDVDTAVDVGNGKVYLFKGAQYLRIDQSSNTVGGAPRPIADGWAGLAELGFADAVQAAVNWGNGKAYFFKGDSYVRFDVGADAVDDGYPRLVADAKGSMSAQNGATPTPEISVPTSQDPASPSTVKGLWGRRVFVGRGCSGTRRGTPKPRCATLHLSLSEWGERRHGAAGTIENPNLAEVATPVCNTLHELG